MLTALLSPILTDTESGAAARAELKCQQHLLRVLLLLQRPDSKNAPTRSLSAAIYMNSHILLQELSAELGASALGAFWFAQAGAVVLPPQPTAALPHLQ